MTITIFYASLLAVFFVFLSFRTIRLRRTLKIGVGDAGNAKMLRGMRVHSNFSEYVPLALLLMFFVEAKLAAPFFVHGLGILLLLGRSAHAFGVSQEQENFKFRVFGMLSTFAVILLSAAYLMFVFIGGLLSSPLL